MNPMPVSRFPNLMHAAAVCALILAAWTPPQSFARTDCRPVLREKCAAQGLSGRDCDAYVQSEIFKLRAKMEEGVDIPDCAPAPDRKERATSEGDDKTFAAFLKDFTAQSGA